MFKIKLVPEDAWAAFRSLGRELGGRVRQLAPSIEAKVYRN